MGNGICALRSMRAVVMSVLIVFVQARAEGANDTSPVSAPPAKRSAPVPAQKVSPAGVAYDKLHDLITISVEQHPLSDVLRDMDRQTGIDFRMDPQAETDITLNIVRMPLESALARLGHLNVIKQYKTVGKGKAAKKLLVRVSVLPQGKIDPEAALRLLDADKEVDYRAGVMSMADRSMKRRNASADLMMQRWETRLGDLTPEQKKHYDDRMQAFADRAVEQERIRQERAAKRAAQRERDISQLPEDLQAEARQGHPQIDPDPAMAAKAARDFPLDKTPSAIYPDQKK